MNKITKHTDRPEFNTEEQLEKDRESHRKLRAYTKKVLKHGYLKSKKEASDTISRLIKHWRFDVPGWTSDAYPCPIFHKTEDDLAVEKAIEDKRNSFLRRGDGSPKTGIGLKNEELAAKYDKLPKLDPPEKPKSNKEKVRNNAAKIMDQFLGTEAAIPMLEAYDNENYLEVFELALNHDARNRENQQKRKAQERDQDRSEMSQTERDALDNSLRCNAKYGPVDWVEIFDEIIEDEGAPEPPTPHAINHCLAALRSLSGDLTYDDRSEAREELLQSVRSLETYPQSSIPMPKAVVDDECSCIACTNTRSLSAVLKDIVSTPSDISKSEQEEIDKLFAEAPETIKRRDESYMKEDRLINFGTTAYTTET